MSMSDCIKCWNTPCTCGYEYRMWSKPARIKLAAVILGVTEQEINQCIKVPLAHPWNE